jgi:hypothetical protein
LLYKNPAGDALAELAATEEITERIRRQGEEASFRASDRNKLFSVTVDGRGEIRELTFRGDGYRELPPAELADLLVKTIERARTEARRRALAGAQELMRELPFPMGDLAEVGSTEELTKEIQRMFSMFTTEDGGEPGRPAQTGRPR